MKHIRIFHNQSAGSTQYSRQQLISSITSAGFDCSYYSTEKDHWEKLIPEEADCIAIAGGDGTVHKIAAELLQHEMLDKRFPIGLIPCGTANNIARMLNITGTPEEIAESWKLKKIQPFDVVKISGIKDKEFIMEGLGFGVFPKLIKKMSDVEEADPEKKLRMALKQLHKIILNFKPKKCTIKIDDKEASGNYLMVEVMNIQSVGPNLNIAPTANVSDGLLDVVLIPESQRTELARYIQSRLLYGKDEAFFGISLKASDVKVEWDGKLLHADDNLVELKKPAIIELSVRKGVLGFLVQ